MPREIFRNYVNPALQRVNDSETLHTGARELLNLAEISPWTLKLVERFAYQGHRFTDNRLQVTVGGVIFENSVWVGAGWTKNGHGVAALHALGFAGVEVGSVLEHPQKGNAKPRQWYFPNGAAMNRLGFNSPGMEVVAENLERYKNSGIPIGISIGVNKNILDKGPDAVFASQAAITRKMLPYATYFALNPASPNTVGLRAYQEETLLRGSVQAIKQVMRERGQKPLFVKIAPDLTLEQVDAVMRVVLDEDLAGIIATNTTNSDEIKTKYGHAGEMGGISGNDDEYRQMSNIIIKHIYTESDGQIDIIGVGGVNSAETAYEKMSYGAKAVQVVTAIRQVGPTLPGRINAGLVEMMDMDGMQRINSLEDIRGSRAKR